MADNKRELSIIVTLKDLASSAISKLGNSYKQEATKIKTSALLLAGSISLIGKNSIKLASDAVETQNRFEAVFNSLTNDATSFVDELSSAVGRNKTEMKDGLASFQGFAIGMGLARQEAFNMATQLQSLSIDFASFNNLSDAEAQQRFISAMSGSSEVLDKFGINLRSAAIENELYKMGINKTTVEATEAEKAMARYNIIMNTMGEQGAVGDAIKTADSYANRLKRLTSNIKTLQENIGLALMPTMSDIAGEMIGLSNNTNQNQQEINKLSEGIFRFVNFIIAMGKAVYAGTSSIINFGASMIDTGKVALMFIADLGENFVNMFKNIGNGVKAILKMFKGDFEGAASEFGNILPATLDKTKSAMNNFTFNSKVSSNEVSNAWSGVGESLNKAINLEGFVPVSLAAKKTYDELANNSKNGSNAITNSSNKSKEAINELLKEFINLDNEYSDISQNISDSLFDLENDHAKSMSSIQDDIFKTQKSMQDLRNSFSDQKQADTESLANEVLKSEQNILKLQNELKGQLSSNKRSELESELALEQKAFTDNADLFKLIEGEISEARRVAGLSNLERAVEEFNKKRELAQIEFKEKIGLLKSEMDVLKSQKENEIKLFNEKKSIIENLRLGIAKSHQDIVTQEFNITKDAVLKEIKLYEELSKAISRVRGGNSADLSRITSAANNTNLNNINIVVKDNNISAESSQEAGQKIADIIMNNIRLNERFAI